MAMPLIYLQTADGYYLNFDMCDPTIEQIVTADLTVASVPTKTPTNPNNYSTSGAGGAVGYNLKLYEDTITLTGLFTSWSDYWNVYNWMKFDHRPKLFVWGPKRYTVHIRRFSGSGKAGQGQIISFNIGLVVVNPPG